MIATSPTTINQQHQQPQQQYQSLLQVADVPKETEFEGLSNLVEAVSRYSDVSGKTLYSCLPSFQEGWKQWGALDDVVRPHIYL